LSNRNSKLVVLGLAIAGTLFLGGCVMTPFPVSGAWTQDVRITLDGKIASGAKEGRACATSYAGFYAFGDASVEAAASNGGITKVKSVEAIVNSRIFMATYCTVVRGS